MGRTGHYDITNDEVAISTSISVTATGEAGEHNPPMALSSNIRCRQVLMVALNQLCVDCTGVKLSTGLNVLSWSMKRLYTTFKS